MSKIAVSGIVKKMNPGWSIVLAVGGIIVILVMNIESHASRHTQLVH